MHGEDEQPETDYVQLWMYKHCYIGIFHVNHNNHVDSRRLLRDVNCSKPQSAVFCVAGETGETDCCCSSASQLRRAQV